LSKEKGKKKKGGVQKRPHSAKVHQKEVHGPLIPGNQNNRWKNPAGHIGIGKQGNLEMGYGSIKIKSPVRLPSLLKTGVSKKRVVPQRNFQDGYPPTKSIRKKRVYEPA